MAEQGTQCPCCKKIAPLEVVPFNTEEGIETVCTECFHNIDHARVYYYGLTKLREIDRAGYFSHNSAEFISAVLGLSGFVDHLKLGQAKPFEVAGSLIIANQCTS